MSLNAPFLAAAAAASLAGGIPFQGYYHAYNAPGYLGDYMEEVAPFTNFITINPMSVDTSLDSSVLAAAARAKSYGLYVILVIEPWIFRTIMDSGELRVSVNEELWLGVRPAIQNGVNAGTIHGFYLCDECYGGAADKATVEAAIALAKRDFPNIPIIMTTNGMDAYTHLGIPRGLDVVSFDMYDACTQESFDHNYRSSVEWLLQNSNAYILLTTEAFDLHCRPGRNPINPTQQSWYVDLAASHPGRIVGLWHFLYSDRVCQATRECFMGTRGYPDVLNYHKQVFSQYVLPAGHSMPPKLLSVSPSVLAKGGSVDIIFEGEAFRSGAVLEFSPPPGSGLPSGEVPLSYYSPLYLYLTGSVPNDIPTGVYTLSIRNSDGKRSETRTVTVTEGNSIN